MKAGSQKFRWKPMIVLILIGFIIHYLTYALPVSRWPETFLGKENQSMRFFFFLPTPLIVWAISPFIFKVFGPEKVT